MSNLGVYYQTLKDYDNMKKYYLMAIEEGNSLAMSNLGVYYQTLKDYDNMKKYYLMAIDKCNNYSMNNLGVYYKEIKDYDNMQKYYSMAIEKGHHYSMNNLNNAIYENFNFNIAFDCLKYLDSKNFKKYNEYVRTHDNINHPNYKPILIDCHVCYENKLKATYNCDCKESTICVDCYAQSSNCPYCRTN
jgi:TPR repeat protein